MREGTHLGQAVEHVKEKWKWKCLMDLPLTLFTARLAVSQLHRLQKLGYGSRRQVQPCVVRRCRFLRQAASISNVEEEGKALSELIVVLSWQQ